MTPEEIKRYRQDTLLRILELASQLVFNVDPVAFYGLSLVETHLYDELGITCEED